MSAPATVFIVDDDPALRDALSLLIEVEGIAVETFKDAEAFLAVCCADWRGCVVTDLRMPGMNGLELQDELARRGISLPLIFLTGYGDIPTTVRAIKSGAVDFLTKPVTGVALLGAVHAALREETRRLQESAAAQAASARLDSLTEREKSVMELAIAGHANKEIARLLDISHRTVEIHKARVMQKTGTASVLELARLAALGGLHA